MTALILARGGSKGILKKNLVEIQNITLLRRTLNTVHDFGCKFLSFIKEIFNKTIITIY